MADHHIYIHGGLGGGNAKATKKTSPKLANKISGDEEGGTQINANKIIGMIQKSYQVANNPVGTALDKAGKAVPFVAAAMAAVEIVKAVVSQSLDIASAYTGNTTMVMQWENAQAGINAILHPITTGLGAISRRIRRDNYNNTAQENRALNGESNGRYV